MNPLNTEPERWGVKGWVLAVLLAVAACVYGYVFVVWYVATFG